MIGHAIGIFEVSTLEQHLLNLHPHRWEAPNGEALWQPAPCFAIDAKNAEDLCCLHMAYPSHVYGLSIVVVNATIK